MIVKMCNLNDLLTIGLL